MGALAIGFAETDITPEGAPQTIYHRTGRSDHAGAPIRDRLHARATAFRTDNATAVWVTLDLIGVSSAFRNRVVEELAGHGIEPDHVVLSATHTHTAPTVVHFHGVVPTPQAYLDSLARSVVQTALRAAKSAKPAELCFGTSPVDLSVNRREIGRISQINDPDAPTGLVDPDVTVATFRILDDDRMGCLFNYGAHPLTMSSERPLISADYPGRTCLALETAGGMAFAQFLQGCSGNVNVKIHGDVAESTEVGRRLADAVLTAAASARPSRSSELRVAAETVRLPWGNMPTPDEARETLQRERAAGREWPRNLEWAEAVCRAYDAGEARPYGEVLVQAVRVGDAVFVALPGEAFVEIGLGVKRQAGTEPVFVVAYSNTCEIGYIPTAAAFAEGGYEVNVAPQYYGLFTLAPDCERIMVEAGLRVLRSTHSDFQARRRAR